MLVKSAGLKKSRTLIAVSRRAKGRGQDISDVELTNKIFKSSNSQLRKIMLYSDFK